MRRSTRLHANEAMPEYLHQALRDLKRGNRNLEDRSYGSGARYLLELIEAHKAEYEQSAAHRI
jgi:hypothetical protein